MKQVQVEVLLASYNGERYITEQIHSILNQSHQNLSLIIRDDCSSDKTQALINELKMKDARIHQVSSGGNLGAQGNFSALMEASTSAYVMLADQDDLWHHDKVEICLKRMLALENAHGPEAPILIHTDLAVVNDKAELIHPSFWKFSHIDPLSTTTLNRLLVQNVVTGCTSMVNRSLLKMALPIPKDTLMHDWWLALVAAAFGVIEVVEESTLLYRQHAHNVLGAKKFASPQFVKASLKKLLNPDPRKIKQAQIFHERYAHLLNDASIQLVEAYLNFQHQGYLKSRYTMVKHGFYKQGFIRNVVAFLLQRIP